MESNSGQRFWLFSSESQKVTKTISFQNDTFLEGASVKITKKSEYQLVINEIQECLNVTLNHSGWEWFKNNRRSVEVILGLFVSINEKQTEDGEWYCQENDKTVKSYRLYVDGKLIKYSFMISSLTMSFNVNYSTITTAIHSLNNYSVAPYIDPLNISVVRKGEDATLICRSSGKPRPELVWKFQNRTLSK